MKDAITKELTHHLIGLNQYNKSNGNKPAYICILSGELFNIAASLKLVIKRSYNYVSYSELFNLIIQT